ESSFGCRPEMAREAVIAGPDVKEGINNDGPRIKDSRLYETALMINALDPGGFGNNPDADNDPVASVSVSASASTIIRVGDFMDLLAGLSGGWWDEQKDMAAATVGLRKEKAAAEQRENAAVTRLAEENKEAGKQQSLLKEYRERLAAILEKSQGNAACALEKCRKYKELTAEMAAFDIRHQALLKNHEAGDEAGLKACLERAGDETAGFMIKWREITEKNPGLPSPRDAADPEKVRQKMDDLNASVDEIEENLDGLKEKRDDLYRRLARLEGSDPINIAAAELDLAELRNKKYKLKLQADALTEAYKELDAAIAEYRNTYRNRLEDKATAYYKQVMAERNIVLDEELVLGIREKGRPVSLFHLSKGARDQLYISLRFAVADLLAESVRLPMIFDDPFVSTDSARLAAFRKIMEEEAAGRQFILLAHSDSYREWGNPVDIR
ncbi:MAG: hypothetical protein PHG48_02535, partial [Eubacteriales bacterium]|nr:hypothetical protein [Eubacteriales bacterium]